MKLKITQTKSTIACLKNQIATIEALKMETNILAAAGGTVEKIYVSEGQQVKAGEMVAKLK